MLLALFAPAFALDCTVLGDVVINELTPETDVEWVEIYNDGTSDVEIAGLTLEWGFELYTENTVTLTASTPLAAGDWYVIGRTSSIPNVDQVEGDLDLGNASSTGDGIRLTCDGVAIDTVVYGPDNDDLFLDESGAAITSIPSKPGDAESLARAPDGVDTNLPGEDFLVCEIPSPGGPTVCTDDTGPVDTGGSGGDTGIVPVVCSLPGEVVINELTWETGIEWVELYNNTADDIPLIGWSLHWGSSSLDSSDKDLEGILPANSFFVVGDASASPDQEENLDLGNATSNADGIQLRCESTAIDTVIYGSPNSDDLPDDSGAVATSLAPTLSDGGSIGRYPDGKDEDLSSRDFTPCDDPTPGSANTCVVILPDCTGADDIVLNEFTFDSENEWVEIYNNGSLSVDITGWAFQWASSPDSFSDEVRIGEGTLLGPGDYFVLGTDGAEVVIDGEATPVELDQAESRIDPGNASSSADAVRLACDGEAVDTLVYGDDGDDTAGWLEDETGEELGGLPGLPGDGETLSRIANGVDSNDTLSDWAVCDQPTPGGENGCIPVPCIVDGIDGLVINEVMYNASDDDTMEWVELYNAGSAPVSIGGFTLEAAKSSWSVQGTFDGTAEVPAGGFLVVGESGVEVADVLIEMDLGDASTSGDGLRLLACDGTVVDTVLYGNDPVEEDMAQDGWEEGPTPGVDQDQSLTRIEDGVDTDLAADWKPESDPTPGLSNATVDTGDPGDPDDTGEEPCLPGDGCCGGCGGNDKPDLPDPTSALLFLGGALGLLVRRRPVRAP